MAKKNEFKADRPYATWFSRLMPTKLQQKAFLKWMLYSLVLLLLSVLQDVFLSRVSIFGTTTELVPCGIFLFCLLEGSERGCLFSLLSSLFYQFSGSAPGIYAIVLITFIGTFVSIFQQAFLQKGLGTAVICTAFSMLSYKACIYVMGVLLKQAQPGRIFLFAVSALLSVIIVPILYPIGLAIGRIGGTSWRE